MFRVYDNEKKRWVKNFYIMPNGDMFTLEKTLFRSKLVFMSKQRYVLHRNIEAYDSKGEMIFEGDIVKNIYSPDQVGVVAYLPRHAAYYVFDNKNSVYYVLSETSCSHEIIGNVFDNPEYVNEQEDVQ